MKKKTISTILAAALTLSMAFGLCACGSSKDTADADTEEAVTIEETEAAEPVEDTEEVADAVEEETEEVAGNTTAEDDNPFTNPDYVPDASAIENEYTAEAVAEGHGTEENPIWQKADPEMSGWSTVPTTNGSKVYCYFQCTKDIDELIDAAENGGYIATYYGDAPERYGLTLDVLYEARDLGLDLGDDYEEIIAMYADEE